MSFVFECIKSILNIFRDFSGDGYMLVLLLMAIALLCVTEKDSRIKTFTVQYPLYVLLVFFCPIWWLYIYFVHNEEILYRILWLLPIGIIIVYALVEVAFRLEGRKRFIAFLLSIVLIISSGKYIYRSFIFTPAENEYHISDTVVKICDEITIPGREIQCCFPDELVTYVRQYTPYVYMPYGRGVLFDYYEYEDELRAIMNSDPIDAKKATETLRDLNTPYLVVSEDKGFTESLSTYGFIYVTTIDGYEIFLDNEAYLGLDFVDYR